MYLFYVVSAFERVFNSGYMVLHKCFQINMSVCVCVRACVWVH